MKKMLALNTILLGVIILSGCSSQQQKNQNQSVSQPNQTTQPSPSVPKKSNNEQVSFEVKEFGFKFPVDATIKDEMTYKIIKPTGVPYSSATFSSKTGGCDGGTIDKIEGTPEKNDTGESQFFTDRLSEIKQFNGFFIFYRYPQAVSCSSKYARIEREVLQAVSYGFENITLIEP
jgi:hypothetical protein